MTVSGFLTKNVLTDVICSFSAANTCSISFVLGFQGEYYIDYEETCHEKQSLTSVSIRNTGSRQAWKTESEEFELKHANFEGSEYFILRGWDIPSSIYFPDGYKSSLEHYSSATRPQKEKNSSIYEAEQHNARFNSGGRNVVY